MDEHIHILLIEDNAEDAQLIQTMLKGPEKVPAAPTSRLKIEWADRLSTGVEHLQAGGVDLVLLDLGLPDSKGLDTLLLVYEHAPNIPIVVLTGLSDVTLSLQAMENGAQDYLLKEQLSGPLLMRVIRHVVVQKELLSSVAEQLAEDQYKKMIRALGNLVSRNVDTSNWYGQSTLRDSVPDHFQDIIQQHKQLVEQCCQGTGQYSRDGVTSLAREFGSAGAGPGDVIAIHAAALEAWGIEQDERSATADCLKATQILGYELLGHLMCYYLNQLGRSNK